jgi:hypothetical protein
MKMSRFAESKFLQELGYVLDRAIGFAVFVGKAEIYGFDDASAPMSKVFTTVDPVVASLGHITGIELAEELVKEAFADALVEVVRMDINLKFEREAIHRTGITIVYDKLADRYC